MIVELEDDICSIQKKLEAQEKSLSSSQQQALEIEAQFEAKQVEMKKLTNQMETKLRTSEAMVNKLNNEKRNLVEHVMKLSTERENLVGFIERLWDRFSEFSREDVKMIGTLERMVQSLSDNGSNMALMGDSEIFKSVEDVENTNPSPPTTKKFQAVLGDRSPFESSTRSWGDVVCRGLLKHSIFHFILFYMYVFLYYYHAVFKHGICCLILYMMQLYKICFSAVRIWPNSSLSLYFYG